MTYHHKQTSSLQIHLIVLFTVLVATAGVFAFLWHQDHDPGSLAVGIAATVVILAFVECFQSLLVRDEGDFLAIRFGPIPLFRKRFPYSKMTAVEASRSSIVDGWGIHYTPGRGWIYNYWGFQCVKIQMGKKTVRIGTDDVDGLVAFLRTKLTSLIPAAQCDPTTP
jgi:hypothetical protein